MSRYDYRDPSTDPARGDALSEPPPDFDCIYCGNIEQDCTHWPYCSSRCAAQAEGESDEDEPNPRERHEDDGREYSDPRDAREERE